MEPNQGVKIDKNNNKIALCVSGLDSMPGKLQLHGKMKNGNYNNISP